MHLSDRTIVVCNEVTVYTHQLSCHYIFPSHAMDQIIDSLANELIDRFKQ